MILPLFYTALFFLHLFLFRRACRKPTRGRFVLLYSAELLSCVAAAIFARYFDSLPGYGMMPGLTYFSEVIFSIAAAHVFAALLLLSLIGELIIRTRKKK